MGIRVSYLNVPYQDLINPCTYELSDSDGKVLYIGLGTSGMGRIFDISLEQKGRTKAFKKCKFVKVLFYLTKEEAEKEETALIHQFHPKGNGFCSKCNYYVKQRPKRLQGRGILFGKTRHAILALLLVNSEKAYFLQEISRLTGVPLSAVQRELKQLVAGSIVERKTMGNGTFYRAIVHSPFFNELRSMILKGA